jgi:nitroreductase
MVRGTQAFVAFIGDTQDMHVLAKIGYYGEGIILEATARGFGTCWVGGYFRPESVASLISMNKDEMVYAITPLGHPLEGYSSEENVMRTVIKAHKRLPLAELVSGLNSELWPAWITSAIAAARLAPSAHNNQPWEFSVSPNNITISINKQRGKIIRFNRVDCGIALLHVQLGAQNAGVNGAFRFLQDPEVALFQTNIA